MPEHTTAHDPYPRDPSQPDPMAERRRNSSGFYDDVDAAIAARATDPTHTTHTEQDDTGYTITHDDGYGTTIRVDPGERVGRIRLEVASLGDTVDIEIPVGVADVLVSVLRTIGNMDVVAPIGGHR